MRIDHKTKVALLRFVTALIRADKVIDTREIQILTGLELSYGFDRSLMAEASQLTIAQAAEHLRSLDKATREPIFDDLLQLAGADKVCNPSEALMLLTLKYPTISIPNAIPQNNLGQYVVYVESEYDDSRHQELNAQNELLQLLLEHYGMNLLYIEQVIATMRKQEAPLVKKVLGYMAPELDNVQLDHAYNRLSELTSTTFCNQLLLRDLQLKELRDIRPSLLVNTPGGFLLIELKESITQHVKELLGHYSQLVSPGQASPQHSISQQSVLPYTGYYRLFMDFVLKTEPTESRIVLWPNKSEFTFPETGRTLRLNQQEASLYTLILAYTYGNKGTGLPLSYTSEQKRIEALYRTIYCRKKLIDTDEVIFPDNLAPIRAKIERKMREQLVGVSNIDDYIPVNEDRKGYYVIHAPKSRVMVKPDSRSEEVQVAEFKW